MSLKQMEKNYKKIICTIMETFIATLLCAIGVTLFVESGLGSDTIDVFIDGIHRILSISLGQADQLFSLVFLILAFLLKRHYIGWPSVLYTLIVGFLIDLVNIVVLPMDLAHQSLWIRYSAIFFAQFCFGMTYAIFQSIERGMNTVDAVIYYVCEKFHLSYIVARTTFDVLFFLLGILLGGVIGIGTLISTCLTGVTTNFLYKKIKKIKQHSTRYCALYQEKEIVG